MEEAILFGTLKYIDAIKFLSDRVIILFSNSYNRLFKMLIIPIVIQYIIILIGAE